MLWPRNTFLFLSLSLYTLSKKSLNQSIPGLLGLLFFTTVLFTGQLISQTAEQTLAESITEVGHVFYIEMALGYFDHLFPNIFYRGKMRNLTSIFDPNCL